MGYIEDIKALAEKIHAIKDNVKTEEATKMSMIMPFFQALGYDVFNPAEVVPEYTADFGTKKGEKVDYAILGEDGNPMILIEAKGVWENLDKHGSQLFRYYATTTAKIGVLTNGILYRFFMDLERENTMDASPFLELDMLHLDENALTELERLQSENLDLDSIASAARSIRFCIGIQQILARQAQYPDDDFVKYFMAQLYDKKATKKNIEVFRGFVKKSFAKFISDRCGLQPEDVIQEELLYLKRSAYIAKNPEDLYAAHNYIKVQDAAGFEAMKKNGSIHVMEEDTPVVLKEFMRGPVARIACPVPGFACCDVYTFDEWLREKKDES